MTAATLLGVIGASLGVVAGKVARASGRMQPEGSVAESPLAQPTPSAAPGSEGLESDGPATGRSGTLATSAATPSRSQVQVDSSRCPEAAMIEVGSELALVLYIETDLSQVWICRAAKDGQLWYQGLSAPNASKRYPNEPIVQGNNGLLLREVQETLVEETEYVASNTDENNQTTTYSVTLEYLSIVNAKGEVIERQAVTRHVP